MIWNNEKDVLLCREILVKEPYKFKFKTRERGQAWTEISEILNQIPELDILLEEIIARSVECANSIAEKSGSEQTDKEIGENVRLQALETFKETQKRQSADGDTSTKSKKSRNTGSDTIAFLKEKMISEAEIREREIDLKKKEIEKQQNNMMNLMSNSMTQMQQMNSSFIQAQQTQTQALYGILEKLAKK
ncbi:uncharacterized protein LOC130636935 [Hydractinia symbiolongicarpus]|uniref:uncharacterized protein LOC130636935 n=1 Tax=Hydractinia symbiolongicarpus TaxID=13093 RepID=UPI00254E3014|nr:uncharacterized protein LOC130636935 [Hydractinia symbiolongicarpus]